MVTFLVSRKHWLNGAVARPWQFVGRAQEDGPQKRRAPWIVGPDLLQRRKRWRFRTRPSTFGSPSLVFGSGLAGGLSLKLCLRQDVKIKFPIRMRPQW